MRIAIAPVAHALGDAPDGWSPGAVAPSTSTRGPGLLRGGLDAWLGLPELSAGVPLTGVQVATLAPFLARAFAMPEAIVAGDLQRVRIHAGGLAANANWATTIGHHVYVADARRATYLLSWPGRRWLAHELGHTLQWRRDGGSDRAFLNHYLGAYVAHDGAPSRGGVAAALREWQRRREAGEPVGSIGDLIHDAHPLEREAERHALTFHAATA